METCFRTCIPKKYLMNNEQVLQVLKFFPVKNDKQIGRPSANIEAIIQGIFYILKTGCQWNALPRCFGPSSTIHDHFQKIARDNIFKKAWQYALEQYDRIVGLALQEQSFDCTHTKSPLGGEKTGSSPVDRKKLGTKRAMLSDKNGIPIAIGAFGGNIHDSQTCISTILNPVYDRQTPFKTIELDAAFDADSIKKSLKKIGYFCKISKNRRRGRSANVLKHSFRWSIERTHSWINRFRRLLTRWEKKLDNFLAMIHFACQTIIFNKTLISG